MLRFVISRQLDRLHVDVRLFKLLDKQTFDPGNAQNIGSEWDFSVSHFSF